MFTSEPGSTTLSTPEITHTVPGVGSGTVIPSTVVKNAFAATPKKKCTHP